MFLVGRSVSVQVGTHVLDLQFQIGLGTLGRTLEGHMFQEVGHSVVAGILVPRSGIDPQTNGGRLGSGILAGHPQTTVQLGHLRRGYVDQGGTEVSGIRRLQTLDQFGSVATHPQGAGQLQERCHGWLSLV